MSRWESYSTEELIDEFRRGTRHLAKMADGLEVAWDPAPQKDPRHVHNMYVRNLVSSYVSRFTELCNGVLASLEREDFLVYALCGRALLETTALLRYYVVREYKPLLDKGTIDGGGIEKLIAIDDRHLRGTGFDWGAFMLHQYSKLSEDAQRRRGHRGSNRRTDYGALPGQVRIGRCIDVWSKETPTVGIAYDLFCDMVHPSAGSSFLIASIGSDGLHFSKMKGQRVGKSIVDQSLLPLLSVTQKPFGQHLAMLIGTMWQDDELEEK